MLLKYLKQKVRQYRLSRAGVLDEGAQPPTMVGDWPVWADAVGAGSVVYAFGVGDNIKWDRAMIERFGVTVHAFDPTPASIAWLKTQQVPKQFVFHDCGISDYDGTMDFYPPSRENNPHYSQERRGRLFDKRPPVQGKVNRLETIMRKLGHKRIDVLKLDVEGSEFEAVPDLIGSGIEVDQLLIEIHYQFRSRSFRQGLELIDRIKSNGMQCNYVSDRGYEFTFVRRGLKAASRSVRKSA